MTINLQDLISLLRISQNVKSDGPVEKNEYIAFVLALQVCFLCQIKSDNVVKELAKLAIMLVNGQKINLAPLVFIS